MRQTRTRSLIGTALYIFLAAAQPLLPMQQDGGILQLRSDTRVVEIDISVRDSHGNPVKGLKPEDFTILDNGKPRLFSIFRAYTIGAADPTAKQPAQPDALPQASALPPNTFSNLGVPRQSSGHSTVILLDAINGWFDNYSAMRKGVIGMLAKIPADEKVALYVIEKQKGLVQLQDYTTDRARLLAAVTGYLPQAMRAAPPGMDMGMDGLIDPVTGHGSPPPQAVGGDSAAASLAMRKASMAAALNIGDDLQRAAESVRISLKTLAQQLGGQPGRKSVFWVTQGFPPVVLWGDGRDNTMNLAWDNTIAALNEANIAVSTVDNNGIGGPPRRWGKGTILPQKQIAEETGGQSFYFRNDLDNVLSEGIADSRSGYALGFYLTKIDGTYHSLKIRIDRPNLNLSYRQGYFSRDETKTTLSGNEPELENLLMNPSDSADVGMTATLEAVPGQPTGKLNIRLRLNADSLSLKETPNGWTGRVDQLFVEFNTEGREVGRLSAKGQFGVTPDQRQSFDRNGALMTQAIPLVPGAVKLSIIVRDTLSGHTGSLNLPLDQLQAK